MKVNTPPGHVPAHPAAEHRRPAAARREHTSAAGFDGDEPASAASPEGAGRDFASVLEEVSRPKERAGGEGDDDAESRDAKSGERTEREPEARRREERRDDGAGQQGGFDHRQAGVREAAAAEPAGARAILHIADLERIISAVRTQALAGGRREVTIELRRSVLEGLRVRLGTDGEGRVTAEFIASSERVRAQLDARSAELADLLRARGVNLAALSTAIDAGASGGDSPGGRSPRFSSAEADTVAAASATSTTPAGQTDDRGDTIGSAEEGGVTYRA